jgi:hypothetical protein
MTRRTLPILKPSHFADGPTHLTGEGLQLDILIDDDDRRTGGVYAGRTFQDTDNFLDKFAARSPTRVVVNPSAPSKIDLVHFLRDVQARELPGEPINVGYGLPEEYQRYWQLEFDDDGLREGQTVVAVAFNPIEVVGYASMRLSVQYSPTDQGLYLHISPILVYVIPSMRGNGYGIDLSIACAFLCTDLLDALYAALPARTTISAMISADYESKGGEFFVRHLLSEMECAIDLLRENGKRKSIEIKGVNLDAGY